MSFNNSISLAKQYLPVLDKLYKYASLTSMLDNLNGIRFKGGNKIEAFKMDMDGAGNYSRNGGYVDGDVTGTWEEKTLERDRGRRFLFDTMDLEESLDQLGKATAMFQTHKVIPELDAYRFAKYATNAGSSTTPVDITAQTDVAALIDAANADMNDDEVPEEGRICFISNKAYKQLKNNVVKFVDNSETNIKKTILMYDNLRIIPVPAKRFNSQITLLDGSTQGQEAGGYSVTAGGYAINFLIVHPTAIWQTVKHQTMNLIPPEYNNESDGYLFKYRYYHDCGLFDNKTKGVHVCLAATANQ